MWTEGTKPHPALQGQGPTASRAVSLRYALRILLFSLNQRKEVERIVWQPYENFQQRATDRDYTGKTEPDVNSERLCAAGFWGTLCYPTVSTQVLCIAQIT